MPFNQAQCKEAHDLLKAHGSTYAASRASGIHHTTLKRRADAYKPQGPSIPVFPEDDVPIEEIIEGMSRRFEKKHAHQQSLRWFPITFKSNEPIGLVLVGDPHVDDNGCNWPLLKRHVEVMRQPGVYAVNIGDANNNWAGRLTQLYADQDTSRGTAWKLVKWLLLDSGIKWLVWLDGNHGSWGDGSQIVREMNAHRVPMQEWSAQFKLVFPEWECRVWAAHDFPGHSMWNSLHAPQKTAHMKDWAHIYACGHTHNWALHQEESASRDFVYWLARSRGYKYLDGYAERLGHQSQKHGASVMAVINPQGSSDVTRVQCFADIEQGAEYLKYLRGGKPG